MKVPSEEDWGNYRSDLDQEWAHRVFAGHTNAEMQAKFRANVIERVDELRFMPAVPFRYYMIGFRDFIKSLEFGDLDAADATSCFLNLVVQKLEQDRNSILPILPELLETVDYVAKNQVAFDADLDIYGDFLEVAKRIYALSAPGGAAPEL
jgi:hypothetical protein